MTTVTIDRRAVVQFFDEKPTESHGHATSICSVAGEDLGIGLLKRYLECEQGVKVSVLSDGCNTGRQRGNRLDGWLHVTGPQHDEVYYQVEVKNWSAHGLVGKELNLDASPDELVAARISNWQLMWDHDKLEPRMQALRKILELMKCPREGGNVEPVACLWRAVHPEGLGSPWFSVDICREDCCFKKLHVFSMSTYLRSLDDTTPIEIEMPNTVRRIEWLNSMFRTAG